MNQRDFVCPSCKAVVVSLDDYPYDQIHDQWDCQGCGKRLEMNYDEVGDDREPEFNLIEVGA